MTTDPLSTRQPAVHEFLTARGWHLTGGADPRHDRFADDPTAGWHYSPSFGGRHLNEVATTPARLQCYFTFADDGTEVLAVLPAGNVHRNGCPDHDTAERVFPFAADGMVDLEELGSVLAKLEPQAEALDPRAVIECLYFGPCGR